LIYPSSSIDGSEGQEEEVVPGGVNDGESN